MTRVQNVEDAIGHHHFFATLTRRGDRLFQLFFAHHAKTGIGTSAHRVFQLDWRNGGSPQLADHHTGRGVSEIAGLFQRVTRRQRRRQHADNRVACPGDVIHFLRLGRHMQRRTTRLQQRHTLLGARYQQCGKLEVGDDFHPAFDDFRFIFTLSGDRFEFRQVRRQQRCPAVAFKFSAFRINQHRNAGIPRQLNHGLHAGQRAFRVV